MTLVSLPWRRRRQLRRRTNGQRVAIPAWTISRTTGMPEALVAEYAAEQ